LLRSEYPIDTKKIKYKCRTVVVPLDRIRIDKSKLNQIDNNVHIYTGITCIAGYLGYAIMLQQYDPSSVNIVISSEAITISVPELLPIRLLTNDVTKAKTFMSHPDIYRPLINIKPVTLHEGDFELVDTYGMRIGCNIIELTKDISVCVASTDYLLMELLRDRIYITPEPYTSMYVKLAEIVDEMRSKDSNLMWWPSLDCYGDSNLPEARVFGLEKLMNPNDTNQLKPRNEYLQAPKCLTRREGFDQSQSHYFLIDGEKDPNLKHTNYKYVINEFNTFLKKQR
jgi:hypothetical protein